MKQYVCHCFFFMKGSNAMLKEKINMEIVAIGSDDGISTYEISRKWGKNGKKALVIELYPTITVDKCENMDASTMHLMNHVSDFGWNEVRIVNLYSQVFSEKPSASQLNGNCDNLAYIEEVLEEAGIKDYDIIIAYGSSLVSHKKTINLKIDLLTMLEKKGLSENVKCISAKNLDTSLEHGTHPLYLGLHYGKEKWELTSFPLKKALNKLEKAIQPVSADVKKAKKRGQKNVPKSNE